MEEEEIALPKSDAKLLKMKYHAIVVTKSGGLHKFFFLKIV